jgi:TldD protein
MIAQNETPVFLLDFLAEKKLDFFDVRSQHTIKTNIQVTDGEIDQLSQDEVSGIGIRVLKLGSWGFSSTTSLEKEDVLAACETAVKISKVKRRRKINFPALEAVEGKKIIQPKIDPLHVPAEDKLSTILGYEKLIKSFDPRIKSTQVRYMDQIDEVSIQNSEGSNVSMSQPGVGLIFNVVSNDGSKSQRTRGRETYLGGYEFFKDPQIEKTAQETAKRSIDLLVAKNAPSGRTTVVMDPSVAGLFLHEAFGHSAEADTNLQGRSFLYNKIGQKVASEYVNVLSDGTLANSLGSYAYDCEAVPATNTKLVDEGIFRSFMHSRETAGALGVKPTANGRAEDYSKPPIVRMNNMYFAPGDSKFEEIVRDTQDGVLLISGGGGLEDPEKGRFQFSVQNCYHIVNGEVREPLRGTSLSGWTLETMLSIDMLSRDLVVDIGSCGKGEPMMQIVPVTNGGPYIRVKNVLLGG